MENNLVMGLFRNCRNCYWSEWNRCEIHGKIREDGKTCINYLNDETHSKHINDKLKSDPKWCRNHWPQLDTVDRRKYIKYYGEP
jgi:hypothetical protein